MLLSSNKVSVSPRSSSAKLKEKTTHPPTMLRIQIVKPLTTFTRLLPKILFWWKKDRLIAFFGLTAKKELKTISSPPIDLLLLN